MKISRIAWVKLLLLSALLLSLAACATSVRLQEKAARHTSLGSAYLGTGQYTAALREFLEAEKLAPEDPRLHYLLGISYHGKGLSDMAIAQFQRSLVLKPNDPEVHNYLGAMYLEKGRWDDAIVSFNMALANILYDTPTVSLYNMGRAYHEKRDYDQALKYYGDALEKDPDNILMPLIEKNIGITWFAKGETEKALSHFQKSVTLAPSLAESHYWLGLCYQKLRRADDAVAALEAAARLAPESEFGRKAKEFLKNQNL
jgi:type IV pilus assembly protein PilF